MLDFSDPYLFLFIYTKTSVAKIQCIEMTQVCLIQDIESSIENLTNRNCKGKTFVLCQLAQEFFKLKQETTFCDFDKLQLYVIERRWEKIVIISRCKHEQFLSAILTNSQRPVVGCLSGGAGILARTKRVSKGTGADRRFVKICSYVKIQYKLK